MKKFSQLMKSSYLAVVAILTGAVLMLGGLFAQAEPAFVVTFGADKSQIAPNEEFQYILTVHNTGTEELHNVVTSQHLSDQVEYVSGTTERERDGVRSAVTDNWMNTGYNFGNLDPDETQYLRFKAKVKPTATVGASVESSMQIKPDELDVIARAYTFTVASADQKTVLRAGNFLTAQNITNGGSESDSNVNADDRNVVEFFGKIVNEGPYEARNVHIQVEFSPDYAKISNPRLILTANNADTVSDSISVTTQDESVMIYYGNHAAMKGVTTGDSGKNCPNECELPDSFHISPLNLGNIGVGESNMVWVKFKASPVAKTPAAPKCDSTCSTKDDCLSAHMCYKVDGAERGNCRLESNPTSASCTPKEDAPKCDSVCSVNGDCLTGHFCYKVGGAEKGNCRRPDNQTNNKCEPPEEKPKCDSVCSSNSECPSNLFCYKTSNNAEKGNCRRVDNEKNNKCEQPEKKKCNSTCSSNSDCPSYLFCHKQSGQNSGLCRRESNPGSMTCENDNEGGFIVMKYRDDNSNASRDSEEKGLSWSFQWDLNGDNNWRDYVTYDTTNGEGGRQGGLKDGDRVRIREIGKSGWVATTSTEVTIEIEEGETKTARFGNRPTQPTVTEHKPPKDLPKTGVDIVAQVLGSVGVGAFGLYLRRRKTV